MVMAIGSGSGWWPEATAGVLDKIDPSMDSRPTGHSRRARASHSLRRDVANIHGVYIGGFCDAKLTDRLRGAIGGHEASLTDIALGAGAAQAGRLEIRPGLLRALLADHLHVESVALGEHVGHAGFDGRSKAGQEGEGCGNTR